MKGSQSDRADDDETQNDFVKRWWLVAVSILWASVLVDALTKEHALWFRLLVVVWGVSIAWTIFGVARKFLTSRRAG
jgi:hypothetical protein